MKWFIRYNNPTPQESERFDTDVEAALFAIVEGYGDQHQTQICCEPEPDEDDDYAREETARNDEGD